ncbi:hypothetical protein LINGRAHAP2_LOCUS22715 [Linum grandiflorum]
MECVPAKPLKPSANITDLVSKFAKVCRLRSIGVLTGENPLSHITSAVIVKGGPLMGESSSCNDATADCSVGGGKEKLQPKIGKVGAHVPYSAEKILAADENFMSQLQTLCNIRRSVKENQFEKMKLDSSRLDSLRAEVLKRGFWRS